MKLADYRSCATHRRYAVGGKASRVAGMWLANLPVPDGFCVEFESDSPDGLYKDRITPGVAELAARSGADCFAVRSSASCEDETERSFAGLFASFCSVPQEDVPKLVLECARSIRRTGLQVLGREVTPSVLVQQMIEVRMGGVVFGCDPLSGDENVMTVEYSHGPTSRVVSGRVNPERFTLRKSELEADLASLGLARRELNVLRQLTNVVPQIERLFGLPQDVEWGWDGEKLWILQSRPVTAVREASWDLAWKFGFQSSGYAKDVNTLWTTANVCEAAPGVLTRLSASMIEFLYRHACRRQMQWTPLVIKDDDAVFGLVHGRLCLCLSSVLELAGQIPLCRISDEYLAEQIGANIIHDKRVQRRPIAGFLWRIPVKALTACLMLLRLPGAAESLRDSAGRLAESLSGQRMAHKSNEELLEIVAATTETCAELFFWHGQTSAFSSTLTEFVDKIVERHSKTDRSVRGVNRLLAALTQVQSAEPVSELMRIARAFRPPPKWLVGIEGEWPDVRLPLSRYEPGRRLLSDIEGFLHRFGYRGVNEFDFLGDTWAERPELIWRTIRELISAEHLQPREDLSDSVRNEGQHTARGLGFRRGLVFKKALAWTRRFIRLRENTRAAITAVFGQFRRAVREAGGRFREQGLIGCADDVVYMTLGEIKSLLEGRNACAQDLDGRILRRKRRRRYWLSRPELPRVFVGACAPKPENRSSEAAKALAGLSVSFGRAEGIARIVTSPDAAATFNAGDILIAPYISPGWAPLFAVAGAIAAERGGQMSHGAIIARELGIPAVVQIEGLLSSVRDGQTVIVDADCGQLTACAD